MDAEQRDNIAEPCVRAQDLRLPAVRHSGHDHDRRFCNRRALKLDKPDPLPKQFVLLLSHNGDLRRLCSVAWQSETTVGVQFVSS